MLHRTARGEGNEWKIQLESSILSSLMTDCHMTRKRKNRKERQGRKGEWERKKGRKINFVTYDLLNKSLTKYPLVEYCDTYTCVHVHVMYIYIIKTCNISS